MSRRRRPSSSHRPNSHDECRAFLEACARGRRPRGARPESPWASLPTDLAHVVIDAYAAKEPVCSLIFRVKWTSLFLLGPTALSADGDGYALAVRRFGVTRSGRWPTWKSVSTQLEHEVGVFSGVPVGKRNLERMLTNRPFSTEILTLACSHSLPLLVRIIVAHGVPLSTPDSQGYYPLILASMRGNLDVVTELLSLPGIDVNLASLRCNLSALMYASSRGHLGMVRALLAAPGIDVNAAPNYTRTTALMLACEHGRADVVAELLAVPGIAAGVSDRFHFTALYRAIRDGHTNVVERFLAMPGIDVNAMVARSTPLALASEHGKNDIVACLLAANGDVNAAGPRGETALMEARSIALVTRLLNTPGVDVNRVDAQGRTALMTADTAKTRLLLGVEGVDVNRAGADGRTALMIAASVCNIENVRLLLRADGIHVGATDFAGKTALEHVGCGVNGERVCNMLRVAINREMAAS